MFKHLKFPEISLRNRQWKCWRSCGIQLVLLEVLANETTEKATSHKI